MDKNVIRMVTHGISYNFFLVYLIPVPTPYIAYLCFFVNRYQIPISSLAKGKGGSAFTSGRLLSRHKGVIDTGFG